MVTTDILIGDSGGGVITKVSKKKKPSRASTQLQAGVSGSTQGPGHRSALQGEANARPASGP